MTIIMALMAASTLLAQQQHHVEEESAVTKHIGKFAAFRHQLVHGDEADFIAYQQTSGNGRWRTISTWIIPQSLCR